MEDKKMPAEAATYMADTSIQPQYSTIPHDCQLDSFIRLERQTRKRVILKAMSNHEMTARQIAYKLGFSDLNAVKPRLTELRKAGKIKAIGKAYDETTQRNVTVYRAVIW